MAKGKPWGYWVKTGIYMEYDRAHDRILLTVDGRLIETTFYSRTAAIEWLRENLAERMR